MLTYQTCNNGKELCYSMCSWHVLTGTFLFNHWDCEVEPAFRNVIHYKCLKMVIFLLNECTSNLWKELEKCTNMSAQGCWPPVLPCTEPYCPPPAGLALPFRMREPWTKGSCLSCALPSRPHPRSISQGPPGPPVCSPLDLRGGYLQAV